MMPLGTTNFVWGPEVALRGISGEGTERDPALGQARQRNSLLVDARLRGGYATQTLFVYGLAGFGGTSGGVRPKSEDGTTITVGSVVGIGAEMALNARWSARAEYTRHDFGQSGLSFGGRALDTNNDVQAITFGISRKF